MSAPGLGPAREPDTGGGPFPHSSTDQLRDLRRALPLSEPRCLEDVFLPKISSSSLYPVGSAAKGPSVENVSPGPVCRGVPRRQLFTPHKLPCPEPRHSSPRPSPFF
ncbi:hypothetical protein ACRRTK_009660 [Alexandromys fortis]